MQFTKTLTVEQVLKTRVWGTQVTEWITESFWREVCRENNLDPDSAHSSNLLVEEDLVHITVTVT